MTSKAFKPIYMFTGCLTVGEGCVPSFSRGVCVFCCFFLLPASTWGRKRRAVLVWVSVSMLWCQLWSSELFSISEVHVRVCVCVHAMLAFRLSLILSAVSQRSQQWALAEQNDSIQRRRQIVTAHTHALNTRWHARLDVYISAWRGVCACVCAVEVSLNICQWECAGRVGKAAAPMKKSVLDAIIFT